MQSKTFYFIVRSQTVHVILSYTLRLQVYVIFEWLCRKRFQKAPFAPVHTRTISFGLELSTFEIVSLKNPGFYHFIMDFLKAKSCKTYSF